MASTHTGRNDPPDKDTDTSGPGRVTPTPNQANSVTSHTDVLTPKPIEIEVEVESDSEASMNVLRFRNSGSTTDTMKNQHHQQQHHPQHESQNYDQRKEEDQQQHLKHQLEQTGQHLEMQNFAEDSTVHSPKTSPVRQTDRNPYDVRLNLSPTSLVDKVTDIPVSKFQDKSLFLPVKKKHNRRNNLSSLQDGQTYGSTPILKQDIPIDLNSPYSISPTKINKTVHPTKPQEHHNLSQPNILQVAPSSSPKLLPSSSTCKTHQYQSSPALHFSNNHPKLKFPSTNRSNFTVINANRSIYAECDTQNINPENKSSITVIDGNMQNRGVNTISVCGGGSTRVRGEIPNNHPNTSDFYAFSAPFTPTSNQNHNKSHVNTINISTVNVRKSPALEIPVDVDVDKANIIAASSMSPVQDEVFQTEKSIPLEKIGNYDADVIKNTDYNSLIKIKETRPSITNFESASINHKGFVDKDKECNLPSSQFRYASSHHASLLSLSSSTASISGSRYRSRTSSPRVAQYRRQERVRTPSDDAAVIDIESRDDGESGLDSTATEIVVLTGNSRGGDLNNTITPSSSSSPAFKAKSNNLNLKSKSSSNLNRGSNISIKSDLNLNNNSSSDVNISYNNKKENNYSDDINTDWINHRLRDNDDEDVKSYHHYHHHQQQSKHRHGRSKTKFYIGNDDTNHFARTSTPTNESKYSLSKENISSLRKQNVLQIDHDGTSLPDYLDTTASSFQGHTDEVDLESTRSSEDKLNVKSFHVDGKTGKLKNIQEANGARECEAGGYISDSASRSVGFDSPTQSGQTKISKRRKHYQKRSNTGVHGTHSNNSSTKRQISNFFGVGRSSTIDQISQKDCGNVAGGNGQESSTKTQNTSPSGEDAGSDSGSTKTSRRSAKRGLGMFPSSNWRRLRNTLKAANEMQVQKKPKHLLTREDSFLRKFSTRNHQTQNSSNLTDEESPRDEQPQVKLGNKFVIQHDGNFMFYWLGVVTVSVLYNLWTCIARQAFKEIQQGCNACWFSFDALFDFIYISDLIVQFRTGYLDQGLVVYDSRKLIDRYIKSRDIYIDVACLIPLDFIQFYIGVHPMIRFPRFLKLHRAFRFLHMLESRTAYPNLIRVASLTHILFLGAHWFAAFYYMISEAEGFTGGWAYPPPEGINADVRRKYLKSLYWSTLTLTTIGDLPQPENANE